MKEWKNVFHLILSNFCWNHRVICCQRFSATIMKLLGFIFEVQGSHWAEAERWLNMKQRKNVVFHEKGKKSSIEQAEKNRRRIWTFVAWILRMKASIVWETNIGLNIDFQYEFWIDVISTTIRQQTAISIKILLFSRVLCIFCVLINATNISMIEP